MKLIGSKTEQDFRNELIFSHESLFRENKMERLLEVLKTHFSSMKTAYILQCTPDQGENIYTFLVNTDVITFIEIDHYDSQVKPIVETIPVTQYKKGLSKIGQIKLAVAIDLAKNDLKT